MKMRQFIATAQLKCQQSNLTCMLMHTVQIHFSDCSTTEASAPYRCYILYVLCENKEVKVVQLLSLIVTEKLCKHALFTPVVL